MPQALPPTEAFTDASLATSGRQVVEIEAQALQEVLNGRAHAMVASAPFPEQQAIRNKDKLYLPLGGETFTKEPIGFAIRKTDPDFLNFLNNWVLVAESEGWLAERYDYWFKTMDWESKIK